MEKDKRHFFNKSILWDSILGTCFIISIILLFQLVRFFGEFALLDPIGDAIRDVEMTDLVFSQIRESPRVDQTVVLVNIGRLNRREIARQLRIINQFEPAVIGIDSYFYGLKEDSVGDMLLSSAFSDIKNLVLVSKLEYDGFSNGYDSIRYSHPVFNSNHTGFANLETDAIDQHHFKVCRSFPPQVNVNGEQALAFSVKVSELYNQDKTHDFLLRNNEYEVINYRGNIADFGQTNYGGRYVALDVNDVFEQKFTPDLIKGKIVLMGYMGDDFNDMSWEDKFYTPLNVKYAGRSNPDMFGVVIHANIVSMILNGDFIGKQSKNAGLLTALIVCFVTVLLFTIIYQRLPLWYDGLTKAIQLVLVFLIFSVNVLIFHWFNYKSNLTTATIVVALAGDSLEVCYGLIKNLFKKTNHKFALSTNRNLT